MSTELLAPGTPEDDDKLAKAIYDSVDFVAKENKKRGITSTEVKNPERACAILALICRRHSEIVEATRTHRSLKATQLQLKAADALEKKLDRVLDDEEKLDKISVKDLALGFGITTDKQRAIHGEGSVVTHEHKVTLEDARKAIDDAKAEVAKATEEKVIDV